MTERTCPECGGELRRDEGLDGVSYQCLLPDCYSYFSREEIEGDDRRFVIGAANLKPDTLVIAPRGEELLRIAADGTVTGTIEGASEAGRVFVESMRGVIHATLEWQDIATAPAAQMPLLLWAKRAGDPTFRQVCGWRYSNQWAIYGCGKSQDCLDIVEPTHWRYQIPSPEAS